MYGQEVAIGSAGAGLAVTGMTVGSWVLIAIAAVAIGSTFVAITVRWKNRHGARP